MSIQIKMSGRLYAHIRGDLVRRHPFAFERVGFVFGRMGTVANGNRLVLLNRYHVIPDDHYIEDRKVGARIGPDALTAAMQAVYHGRTSREGIFHVHHHAHEGEPQMSGVDRRETPQLMPGFQSVGRDAAHGIIILSNDHGAAWVWFPREKEPVQASQVAVAGAPLVVFEHADEH